MSRRFHRPLGARVVAEIGVVKLSDRKGVRFNLVRENGKLIGEVEHVALKPDGRPVALPHPQRLVMAEPVALRFIEAAAGMGAALREGKP